MTKIDQVVVIHDYSVPEGGAGILAFEAIKQYRALGYAVTLITGQASTPQLEELGVSVCGLGSKGLLELSAMQAMRSGYHNGAACEMVSAWLAENDTPGTVYHMHNWSQILSPSVFKALRPVAARMIVTCHDFFNICPNGSFTDFQRTEVCEVRPLSTACFFKQCDRRSAVHKYWRFARHLHLNNVAAFADHPATFSFIHEEMQEKFVRSGFSARNTVVIPNPASAWTKDRIKAEANAGFLFVGRVGLDKGADIALSAAAAVGQKLTVIGSGSLHTPETERQYPAADFVGWKTPAEIASYARTSRALLVPSRVVEPFGLVILEAAMSGLPVIVSDRAYLSGDVERIGFGAQVSVSGIESCADQLRALAADDGLVERMSRTGYELAASLCKTPSGWIESHLEEFSRKLHELGVNRT